MGESAIFFRVILLRSGIGDLIMEIILIIIYSINLLILLWFCACLLTSRPKKPDSEQESERIDRQPDY